MPQEFSSQKHLQVAGWSNLWARTNRRSCTLTPCSRQNHEARPMVLTLFGVWASGVRHSQSAGQIWLADQTNALDQACELTQSTRFGAMNQPHALGPTLPTRSGAMHQA